MSILIKGMEMPTSCRKCMISQPDGCGWICPIIESKPIVDGRVNSRHPHCPLVPVPPHGRLIDADALRAKQQEDADLFQGSTAYGDKCRRDEAMNAVANIVNAPTIILAEEGE